MKEYINNGVFEFSKLGNTIVRRSVLSNEGQRELQDKLAAQEPIIKEEVVAMIQKIRQEVIECEPLQLLNYAQMMFIHTNIGVSSEFQHMGLESMAVTHAVEYIQSICVSSPINPQKQEDSTDVFNEICADIEKLYEKVMAYYLAFSAAYKETHENCDEYIDELVEAQMFYSVKGERYQCFEEIYYKYLLQPHNDVFQRLFGLTSQEVIEGITKMQYALSQGRIDPIYELRNMFQSLEDVPENRLEDVMESQRDKGQELIQRFLGTASNEVCKVTGWNKKIVKELSYGINECPEFWNQGDYPGWPIIDLPISKRPFIRIHDDYYCFDYYTFSDSIYRAIQKAVTRMDSTYSWSVVQNEASESMVESIFQKLLPGCISYRNNYYPAKESLKQLCENDLLVKYEDVLFIIEVKAGSFVKTPPLTDFANHISSYKKLIEEPNLQCIRTKNYLGVNQIAKFYDSDKSEKFSIDMTRIKDVFLFSVSVDNIDEFASRAEKMSFIKTDCGAISIAVDDLLVYQDYFDSPLRFIHFLKQRAKASLLPNLITSDELDHLGMYIHHNCYAMYFNNSDAGRINPIGYREDLDQYYAQKYHMNKNTSKPTQKIPELFEDILSFMERNDTPKRTLISDYLLNFSTEAKDEFSRMVTQTYEYQKKTHCIRNITTGGRNEFELRYSCFVIQSSIVPLSHNEQDEYVWANMLWNEDSDRVGITITFDDEQKITDIDFQIYDINSIPLERREYLYERGKSLAAARVSKHRMKYGNKIGRNESCPCGSGKKYKKCCGR